METKVKTIFTTIIVTVIALVGFLSNVPVVRADALEDSCANKENGFPGAMCDAIRALRLQVSSLESIISIDAAGNATIQPAGSLTLDSGGMTKVMDNIMLEGDATTMGDSTVMGDTMLAKDTTVMGDTMLEGDTTLMQETNVAGTFVRPFATATINLDGGLVPDSGVLSSSISVTQRESPLFSIPAATLEGTTLIVKFLPDPNDPNAPTGLSVFSFLFSSSGDPMVPKNIALKPESTQYRMSANDFLVLNWEGTLWEEIARSSGSGAVAVLKTESFPVGIGVARLPNP